MMELVWIAELFLVVLSRYLEHEIFLIPITNFGDFRFIFESTFRWKFLFKYIYVSNNDLWKFLESK